MSRYFFPSVLNLNKTLGSIGWTMQTNETEESSRGEKHMEIAPFLLIFGIALVVIGFLLIAVTTIERIASPGSVFDLAGFGLIGAGIISILGSWYKLS
jgi:hypothetical protein